MGNRAVAPDVIPGVPAVVRRIDSVRLGVSGRIHDVPLRDLLGDLRYPVALYTQTEYLPDHLGGLFIHDPMQAVLRVFDIPVWRIRAEWLASLSFRLENGAYLAARVFGVELVENVDERRHVVFSLIVAVNAVVDGDEADVGVRENHLRVHTDLQIITTEAAHILYDNRANLAVIHQFHEPVPVRAVEGRAAVAIVHEQGCVAETVIIRVLLQHGFLVLDAVGIALQFIVP